MILIVRLGKIFFIICLIVVDCHGSITLIVAGLGSVRTIDRNLKEVCSKAMTMGVIVREQSSL